MILRMLAHWLYLRCFQNSTHNFFFVLCMFLQLIYHATTHALIHHLWHLTPTCFSTEVPSSGNVDNKGIQTNMPICVLLLLIGMSEVLKC